MNPERVETFARWLQAQPKVTAEQCKAHPCCPLDVDGDPLPLDIIRTLLDEAGYVLLDPLPLLAGEHRTYAPAPMTKVDANGHRVMRPPIVPATASLLSDYVLTVGSPTPPNVPGMWMWVLKGGRSSNVRFRPCVEGMRKDTAFLWPDKSRRNWKATAEVHRYDDNTYEGFDNEHGTWYCAPLPADAFTWLLQIDTGVDDA